MSGSPQTIRIDAPTGIDPLVIAQAVMGHDWLVKASPRERESLGKHRALREAAEEFCASYERALKKVLDLFVQALDKEALRKSVKPRPLVSHERLRELAQMIRDMHVGIAVQGMSPETAPRKQIEDLIRRGILPKSAHSIIDDAFLYGQLLGQLNTLDQTKRLSQYSYDQFKKQIKAKPIASTLHERAAMEYARKSAAQYVVGLGNRVADDVSAMVLEEDRKLAAKYRKVIRDATVENIERRETVRKLASDIGHKTGDWTRDLRRIAATEKQRAMQEGQRERLIARHGDPEAVRVAKIPDPDACKHCVKLHLTGGPGSKPRIFKLSQLETNGTNVGRKADDWKATVGPVHPWCACELVHVPEGWDFNEEGNLVPDRVRKRSTLIHDLRKALSYTESVPEHGVVVRVGDPAIVAVIDEVIARTPDVLFNKRIGVTLITADHPNQNSHLLDTDLAYWTGNEIRIQQNLPVEKVRGVIEHELGHSLNVYLMHRFGGTKPVHEWHEKLAAISRSEGYVSAYAAQSPIENAAEVTRLYLYENERLRTRAPRQYAFVHRAYAPLFDAEKVREAFGLTPDAEADFSTADEMWQRFDTAALRHGMSVEALPNGSRIYKLGDGPCLAVMSGLHGEERAGPIALLRWLEDTAAGELVPEGAALWMCPLFVGAAWDHVERSVHDVDFNDVWIPGAKGRTDSVHAVERSLRSAKPHTYLDLHEDAEARVPYLYGYEKDRTFAPKLASALGVRLDRWRGKDEASHGASETLARGLGCLRTSTVETPSTATLSARVAFHLDAVRWCAAQLPTEST